MITEIQVPDNAIEIIEEATESVETFISEINERPFQTYYKFMDESISDGTMITPEIRILYGKGGTMKTTFILTEMKKHLEADNNNLYVFHTLEMPKDQIVSYLMRMLFYEYNYKSLQSHMSYKDRFIEMCDGKLLIVDEYRTMGEIEAFSNFVSNDFPKKRIHNYIDSLTLLDINDEHYNDDNAMAKKVMARVQKMNKVHRMVSTIIHHTNKEGEYLGSVSIRNLCRIMIEFKHDFENKRVFLRFEKLTRQNRDSEFLTNTPFVFRSESGQMLEGVIANNNEH